MSPARCGSTLLRYLLDSHPELTSPPELNLSALLQHLAEVWTNADAALGLTAPTVNGRPPTFSPDVRRRARGPVDQIMVTAANAAGASVYCDKSLTTVEHLTTIAQCYPKAALIFLYRYPLDMIASGMEAGKWGFGAYGFAPFIAANQGNFVAGLANYWIDRITRMVTFERECELAHARIYYELLCDDPGTALSGLFEFLDVAPDEDVVKRAFSSEHSRGPGDYKIDYTGSIGVDSVGRGSSLPEHIAEAQIQRIDELLAELDYPSLAAARRGDLATLLGLKHAGQVQDASAELVKSTIALLSGRAPARPHLTTGPQPILPIELLLRGRGGEEPVLAINVDGTVARVEGDGADSSAPRPRVRCVGDVLLRISSGETPFAQAVHDGEIRVEQGNASESQPPVQPHKVLALLAGLLRAET